MSLISSQCPCDLLRCRPLEASPGLTFPSSPSSATLNGTRSILAAGSEPPVSPDGNVWGNMCEESCCDSCSQDDTLKSLRVVMYSPVFVLPRDLLNSWEGCVRVFERLIIFILFFYRTVLRINSCKRSMTRTAEKMKAPDTILGHLP